MNRKYQIWETQDGNFIVVEKISHIKATNGGDHFLVCMDNGSTITVSERDTKGIVHLIKDNLLNG